jgi:polar amino acid transport system substrate-binding protein
MRRILLTAAVAVAGSALAACGSSVSSTAGGNSSATGAATGNCSNAAIQKDLYAKGVLTIGTDKPAPPPWFQGNDPASGKGYESALAYDVAAQLGFTKPQVNWVYEPFSKAYTPGPKKFDFDVGEISVTPQRAQAVSFSGSYFNVQQSLVALKGTPITTRHTAADLRGYVFGDQAGTTSLAFVNGEIQPTQRPRVYQTMDEVTQALQNHQIAALVTDTASAQSISSSGIMGSVMVGRFPSTGEHFGLLFSKGNPLVGCVNQALATLKGNGTLAALQKKYLQIYFRGPTLNP